MVTNEVSLCCKCFKQRNLGDIHIKLTYFVHIWNISIIPSHKKMKFNPLFISNSRFNWVQGKILQLYSFKGHINNVRDTKQQSHRGILIISLQRVFLSFQASLVANINNLKRNAEKKKSPRGGSLKRKDSFLEDLLHLRYLSLFKC